MRPLLVLRLLLSSSGVERKRAALTVAGIAWGTVAILLLLAFGQGLHHQLARNQRGMGENLAVLWPGQTGRPWQGLPEGRPIQVRREDVELIRRRVPELAGACGEMQQWGVNMTSGGTTVNAHVRGVHWQYGELRNQIPAPGGRFLDPLDERLKRRVVFIGDELATKLFGTDDPVGRQALLDQVPYTVVGVLVHKLMMGNYGGMDSDHAVIPITTFEAQFGRQLLDVIVLKPTRPELMGAALAGVKRALSARHAFDPDDDKVFGVWDTVETTRTFAAFLVGLELFLAVVGALTLLVGGIGVANIMVAVVRERTREIGVKMALGARRSWITLPVVLEALSFTVLGGALGLAIAASVVWALGRIPTGGNLALEMIGRPRLSPAVGLGTAALLGLVGLLAGYFPARRAASVDPAETLRYE